MEKTTREYIKRTQKDYPTSLKLSIVKEYETHNVSLNELKRKYGIQGDRTIRNWIEKFGNFDKLNQISCPMKKTKDQQLLELEQQVKFLERKNARLEKELEQQDLKAGFFDLMIDIAEKEYKIDIRKNFYPDQSTNIKK